MWRSSGQQSHNTGLTDVSDAASVMPVRLEERTDEDRASDEAQADCAGDALDAVSHLLHNVLLTPSSSQVLCTL